MPSKWLKFSESDQDELQWDYPYHYFLSLLACTVSLNDLVKFPERCIRYGGVWFFGLHLFFTIVFAFPFFALENLLGQCTGGTAMQTIDVICPILGGFGITIMFTRMVELVEVSTWLCWNFMYLFASFIPDLPWLSCGHHWTNESCYTKAQDENCGKSSKTYYNKRCRTATEICLQNNYSSYNGSHCITDSSVALLSEVGLRVEPGYQFMLYVTESPIHFTDISDAYILLTFTMCWMFYYMCIRNGMKSSIMVSHLTVTYTFLALLILLVTTMLSPGGIEGIAYHMMPKENAFTNGKAWMEALRSALDTFTLGFAVNFMFATHNDYRYNFMRPLSFVVGIDILFCLLFSFVVAAFLGMAAVKEGIQVDQMTYATEGTPLLLDSVPRIFRHLPSPNIFCSIFYLFCISISVEIGFVLLETILATLSSKTIFVQQHMHRARLALCFSQWCIGLFFFTEPGKKTIHYVKICNALDSDFLFAIEAILITWVYGFCSSEKQKHFRDLKDMLGYLPKYHYYLKAGFYITAPICSLAYTIIRFSTFQMFPVKETLWWEWIVYLFLLLRSPCLLLIYAIMKICQYRKKRKPLKYLFVPEEEEWFAESTLYMKKLSH